MITLAKPDKETKLAQNLPPQWANYSRNLFQNSQKAGRRKEHAKCKSIWLLGASQCLRTTWP